jgi:hypothetical protein
MRERGNGSSVILCDLWSHMTTQCATAMKSSVSSSYMTQCAEAMRSSVSSSYMTECAEAMRSSVAWFHMTIICTSNDGLTVSHNLTLWHNVAGMRFFVSWFDMVTECSRIRFFVSWFDIITQRSSNEILSHDFIWHNSATMRSFVSWSHMMTVQEQLHLVFPMISYDDRVSQACYSRLKRA